MEIIQVLEKYFGFKSFRPGQEEIIRSILDGNDTLAIMPTGGGKSICYQLPALMLEGTAIVISPLIALMKDQVDALTEKGIPATFINSSISFEELQERLKNVLLGAYKIIYIAPERLESEFFKRLIANITVSFLAVDEAHCISEWGHDFRPAYLNISKALENINIRPVAAFTATAGTDVQKDIIYYLKMNNAKKFIRGFDRPNLTYHTIETKNKIQIIAEILKSTPNGSSIVYCGSRSRVEETSQKLSNMGFNCAAYHGGIQMDIRTQVQNQFITGEKPIIVATNAFGMGIDKSDVRNVIHIDYTASLEAYYQEAGRAGRDGNPANCYLLHNNQDYALQEFFIANSFPEREEIERIYVTLVGNCDKSKRLRLPIAELANQAAANESLVSTVLDILERSEIIKISRRNAFAMIKFIATTDEIRYFMQNTTEERRQTLSAILKSVSAEAFRRSVEFDYNSLLFKFALNKNVLDDTLRTLSILRFIEYSDGASSGEIELLETSKSVLKEKLKYDEIAKRRSIAYSKLNEVINYAYTNNCKRNYLLDYFQDDSYTDICGRCSSCTNKSTIKLSSQKQEYILQTFLKALYEVNNKFGKTVIIQMLKGKSSSNIKKHNLEGNPFFGSLKDASEYEIRQSIEKAIAKRLVLVSSGLYPILSLSSYGMQMIGKIDETQSSNNELIQKLKSIRTKIAQMEGISERSVASDKAIRIIAKNPDLSFKDFINTPGISKFILQKYAEEFYKAINSNFQNIDENETVDENLLNIAKLLNRKQKIEEIAKIYNTDKGSIARIVQDGIMNDKITLDWRNFVSEAVFLKIKTIIYKKPAITLSRLRDLIAVDIDYAVLRIIVAIARKSIV